METRKHTRQGTRGGTHQAVGGWIRKTTRLAVYLRDGFRCVYCCKDLHGAHPMDVTLDHIRCQSDGGTHAVTNLVTSCRSCNCSRQDTPIGRFASAEVRGDIRRLTRRNMKKYRRLANAILSGDVGLEEAIWRDGE